MLYTGVIGVEVLNEVSSVNDKVDHLVLESVAREVGTGANLHWVKGMVAAVDHQVNLV